MHRRSRPEVDRDQKIRRSRWRFLVRAMTIAVASAAVFIVCLMSFLLSAGWISRPIELAPPTPRANTDHDLFDIVFSDLIGDTESAPHFRFNIPMPEDLPCPLCRGILTTVAWRWSASTLAGHPPKTLDITCFGK
jgi:hypothetical protein